MNYIPRRKPSGGFRNLQQHGISPSTDLMSIIKYDYQEAVEQLKEIPEELRRSLRAHERLPIFLTNLYDGIKLWQKKYPNRRPDRVKIKKIVYDMTATFAQMAKRQHDEAYLSEAAKTAALKKAQEQAELEATEEGTPSGIYEEIADRGIEIGETTEVEINGEDKNAKAKSESSKRRG